jgi:hypothetical protein
MAQYRRVKVGRRGMAENLASQSAQLPWFVRNVIIKVLLTARLGFLTPLLGHRSRDWPY